MIDEYRWEPSEEELGDYLELIYDPEPDLDPFEEFRGLVGHGYEEEDAKAI